MAVREAEAAAEGPVCGEKGALKAKVERLMGGEGADSSCLAYKTLHQGR